MVIAQLKNVYFSVQAAKHQSTWFTSSAYRIFYEVPNEVQFCKLCVGKLGK